MSLLTGVEKGFTERLGSKDKCLCCSPRAATIVICILLVLAVIYNLFVNTYMRWGKPCYIWWEHWATSVTFFVGLIARLCIFPVAVLTLVELQKVSWAVQEASRMCMGRPPVGVKGEGCGPQPGAVWYHTGRERYQISAGNVPRLGDPPASSIHKFLSTSTVLATCSLHVALTGRPTMHGLRSWPSPSCCRWTYSCACLVSICCLL